MKNKTPKIVLRIVLATAGLFALLVLFAAVFYMARGGDEYKPMEEAERRDDRDRRRQAEQKAQGVGVVESVMKIDK